MRTVLLSTLLLTLSPGPAHPAAVVQAAGPGGAALQAGIRPGDLLVSWSRGEPPVASGPVASPFDLLRVEIEQAPLGRITLQGSRDGKPFSATLAPGEWKLEASALPDPSDEPDPVTRAWRVFEEARRLARDGRWDEAQTKVQEAAPLAADLGDPIFPAMLWHAWGIQCQAASRFEQAEAAHQTALDAGKAASEHGLLVAECLSRLGYVALKRADLSAAEKHLIAALEMRRDLAPESAAQARTLNTLGVTLRHRGGPGDYDRAEQRHREALAIMEKIFPSGYDAAYSLMALGNVAFMRGDLTAASSFYDRAALLFDKAAPGTLGQASVLVNLGNVSENRGDLSRAQEFYRQAGAIRQRLAPDSLEVAQSYAGLGHVALDSGDLEAARDHYLRSLGIQERQAPVSEETAACYLNLASVEIEAGDLSRAEAYYRKSLDVAKARSSENVDVATALKSIGDLAMLQGDYGKAEELLQRAVAMWKRLAPDNTLTAWTLYSLGELERERGRLEPALRYHREALELRTTWAPDSWLEATSAAAVARVLQLMGKPEEALRMYQRAVAALEAQEGSLGGVERVRTVFRSKYMSIYRDTIDLLVDRGRDVEAFDLLERSRARGLREMLAERELVFSADIPEELDRRRRMAAVEHDRLREALQEHSSTDSSDEAEALRAQLRELRRRQEQIRDEIRRRAPRLAALQQPEALGLDAVERSLDAGTALLSYSVGRDRTLLFAIDVARRLSVHAIPLGEEALASRVRALREAIQAVDRTDAAEQMRLGESLYGALVAPAESALASADRVVVVPDGPLYLLPFAALRRPAAGERRSEYLVEWKPLHLTASMTVHQELRSRRRRTWPATSPALVAFGDARYGPAAAEGAVAARKTVSSSGAGHLGPLPASRVEVEAITRLYGDGARMLVQDEATETRARAVGRDVRMIHFAAHAVVDERHPLDSGIALTTPATVRYGEDNGLLQAWEILESVRIDADLVTLSGCETALGRELAGEGIIGLTRAFQYAGARSVAASLWSVPDRSTALLMERFYGYLKRGLAKDEALRAAQIDLIRGAADGRPDAAEGTRGMKRLAKSGAPPVSYASPFYWAAFQLYGDWK